MKLQAALLAAVAVGIGTGMLVGVVPTRGRPRTGRRREVDRGALRRVVALAGVAGLMTVAATRSAPLSAVAAVAAVVADRRITMRKRRREAAALCAAWPDGLRHIMSVVQSGSSVEAGIVDLARSAPVPLQGVLRRLESRSGVLGFRGALEALRSDVSDATTDRVVEVLVLAHERGGSLVPAILDDLAGAIAADLRTAGEIRTAGLEQRLNARIVLIVPWAMLGLLTLRPGPYRSFYASRPGLIVMVLGAVLSAGGAALAARLGRSPVEPRVLTGGGA